jgi:hypothetical protein
MTAHPVSPILLDRDQAWQVIGAQRLGLAGLDDLPDLAPFLPENIEDIEDENARP